MKQRPNAFQIFNHCSMKKEEITGFVSYPKKKNESQLVFEFAVIFLSIADTEFTFTLGKWTQAIIHCLMACVEAFSHHQVVIVGGHCQFIPHFFARFHEIRLIYKS